MWLIEKPRLDQIIIDVINANSDAKELVLFFPFKYRTEKNFGNNSGVNITSGTEQSYHEILAMIENIPFICRNIEIITHDKALLERHIDFKTHYTHSGTRHYTFVGQRHKELRITGNSEMRMWIDGSTSVRFVFHHSKKRLSLWRILLVNIIRKLIKDDND